MKFAKYWREQIEKAYNYLLAGFCFLLAFSSPGRFIYRGSGNDPGMRNRTGDVTTYNKLVFQQAGQTYQSNNPDPDSNTSIHMSTGIRTKMNGRIECFVAGIRKYISWLELNCPNDNRLAVAKDRLAALKANRTR